MNDVKPLVSVLMTAFNREKYIAEAIESVLASTFKDFELIIVDDCSTDKTVSIAKKYERLDTRVSVYLNDKNLQQFTNRNKAASYANGEFLKYFDSDDIMYNNCLEVSVAAMKKFPEAGAGCEHKANSKNLPICYHPRELYINHFSKGNPLLFTGPTDTIIRKKIFDEIGGFDEGIGILADTLFLLTLASRFDMVGYQTGLTFYRVHDEQVAVGQADWPAMLIERYIINEKVLKSESCPFDKKEKLKIRRNVKNILVRNLIKYSFQNNFTEVRKVYDSTDLNIKDCILSLFPNKKLPIKENA